MKNGDEIVSIISAAGHYAEYGDVDGISFNPVRISRWRERRRCRRCRALGS
jgi:hypothetical protein